MFLGTYLTLDASSWRRFLFSLQPKKLRTAKTKDTHPQIVRSVKGVVAPASKAKSPATKNAANYK